MKNTDGSEIILSVNDSNSVSVNIKKITSDYITLRYSTLNDNNPNENQNYLALWSDVSEGSIPWKRTPDNIYKIMSTAADDDVSFNKLALSEGKYMLAYSLVPYNEKVLTANYCTSAYIPSLDAVGDEITYSQTKLSIEDYGSSYVNIKYKTLDKFNPSKNHNWIGIWRDTTNIIDVDPIAFEKVNSENLEDIITFNNIKMVKGKKYMVAYFMSGYDDKASNLSKKAMACYVTFTVQ